jgi:hypothetical protein
MRLGLLWALGCGDVCVEAPASDGDTDGCNALPVAAPVAEERRNLRRPKAYGGDVRPGTYVLTALDSYTGSGGATGTTGYQIEDTLSFDGASYAEARADGTFEDGLGDVARESGTFTTSEGAQLTRHAACGIGGVPVSYSMIGASLHLYFVGRDYTFAPVCAGP